MRHRNERKKVKLFLNNSWVVRKEFEPLDISNGINWDYQHSSNAKTYQTYMHSLDILKDLMKISEVDEDTHLEKKARKLILDWSGKDHTLGENHAWKEHPVSSRINNIIHFQTTANKFKLSRKTFSKILITHCKYLSNEGNYKFNNHGLMMDNALINAACHLKDGEKKDLYIDKAIYRIRYAIQRDFSRYGVHLENSPEYHRVVLILYSSIEKNLKKIERNLGKKETEILRLAHEYKGYVIQPNNAYPMIGDTGYIKDNKVEKKFKDFHDTEAGITIFNNYNRNSAQESSMLIFKSGYHNKTHKHYDDLSTYLYLEGEELLIDSGKYSYNAEDSIRNFIVSPRAHNTILIKGEKYNLVNSSKEQFKLKITRRVSKPRYKMVIGINNLYESTNLTRYNIFTNENVCIIIDRVVSRESLEVIQNFNLNEMAKIKKINNLKYEIILNNKLYNIETYPRLNSNIISSIDKGYISRSFSDYDENERILFTQKGQNLTYITVINPIKNDITINYVKLNINKLIYSINGKEVSVDL